ncbi:hypothetical protein I4U23_006619 [Adineta vaga]|nr:hypothetical protein I4U23_006619 [Adineta vaga]
MNNQYFPSYDYSFEYSSPSTSTYYGSPFIPSTCPLHSPQTFYTSTISPMNLSPMPYTYQQPQQSQTRVYSSSIQTHSAIDRTPLRRHQCFRKNELQILHQAYIRDAHPSTDILRQLAVQLNVSIDKVRQWFKNRRHSDKQKRREIQSSKST